MMTLNKRKCSKCQEGGLAVRGSGSLSCYQACVQTVIFFLPDKIPVKFSQRALMQRVISLICTEGPDTWPNRERKKKQTEGKEQHSFLWKLPQKLQTEGVKSPLANAAEKLSFIKSLFNNTHNNRCTQKPLFCFYYTNSLKKILFFHFNHDDIKMLAEMSLKSPTNGYGPWDATKDCGKGVLQERGATEQCIMD